MITTRQITVHLKKGPKELVRKTTKDIDASIKVEYPKEPVKAQGVSTTSLSDIADIAEKKRRDEIMAERKTVEKGDVVYQDEKGELLIGDITEKTLEEFAEEPIVEIVKTNEQKKLEIKDEKKIMQTRKKPWKDMTDEEKKAERKERMAKARAAKKEKKK